MPRVLPRETTREVELCSEAILAALDEFGEKDIGVILAGMADAIQDIAAREPDLEEQALDEVVSRLDNWE